MTKQKTYAAEKQEQRFISNLVGGYQHCSDLGAYAASRAVRDRGFEEVGSTDIEFWSTLRLDCSSQSLAHYHIIQMARRHLHLNINILKPDAKRGEQIYIKEFVEEGA